MTMSSSSSLTTKAPKSLLRRTRMMRRRRTGRRRSTMNTSSACSKRSSRAAACSSSNGNKNDSVPEKLMALKNLIPTASRNTEDVAADELFQETADYILRLRTQVFVLQHLIQFYNKHNDDDENNDNAIVL